MDRPDLTRRQMVERFPYGDGRGFCGLEWQPMEDGRLLVTAFEMPGNPGRSVTEATGVDPARVAWSESYFLARPKQPAGPPRESWQRWEPLTWSRRPRADR